MAADVKEKENAWEMRNCLTLLQPWICACFHRDLTKSMTFKPNRENPMAAWARIINSGSTVGLSASG
ncbi:MAG: hypothetical protein KGS61_05455 [Verrucomicrobia bacterium]|nr:hypothetical protein [Verrucomicrobiota bacterium]